MASGEYGYTSFYTTNPTYSGNVNDGATLLAKLNTTGKHWHWRWNGPSACRQHTRHCVLVVRHRDGG